MIGGMGRSWTVPVFILNGHFPDAFPADEDPHYRISKLCRVSVTLGKGQIPLGKVFVECNTRQTTPGKDSHGKVDFAECRISGTRQSSHVAPLWAGTLPSA